MSSRHTARSIAMQTLYEWDFRNKDHMRLDDILSTNITEFGAGVDDLAFIKTTVKETIKIQIPHLGVS